MLGYVATLLNLQVLFISERECRICEWWPQGFGRTRLWCSKVLSLHYLGETEEKPRNTTFRRYCLYTYQLWVWMEVVKYPTSTRIGREQIPRVSYIATPSITVIMAPVITPGVFHYFSCDVTDIRTGFPPPRQEYVLNFAATPFCSVILRSRVTSDESCRSSAKYVTCVSGINNDIIHAFSKRVWMQETWAWLRPAPPLLQTNPLTSFLYD